MYPRLLVSLLALAAGFLIFAQTAKAALPHAILSDLAASHTHSWADNGTPFRTLEAKYKHGERLYVTCGWISEVARQLLVQVGYTARIVQVITREPFDGVNDGHVMVEVFYEGRWQLYDVDANVRAVDDQGQGISLVEQIHAVREDRAHWEQIADDPLYRSDEPNERLRGIAEAVFTDPEGFYKRIMGTAFLPADAAGTGNAGLYYIDDDQTDRLRTAGLLAGRHLATPTLWWNLTGVGTAPARTTTTVASTTPPTPGPASAATTEPPTPILTSKPSIHERQAQRCGRYKSKRRAARCRRMVRRARLR